MVDLLHCVMMPTACMVWSGLTHKELAKVQEGNALLAVTQTILSLCQQLGIPWALENPWTSRIWLTPLLSQWQSQYSFIRIDFCAFHVPWRKSTGILFGNGLFLAKLGM